MFGDEEVRHGAFAASDDPLLTLLPKKGNPASQQGYLYDVVVSSEILPT